MGAAIRQHVTELRAQELETARLRGEYVPLLLRVLRQVVELLVDGRTARVEAAVAAVLPEIVLDARRRGPLGRRQPLRRREVFPAIVDDGPDDTPLLDHELRKDRLRA